MNPARRQSSFSPVDPFKPSVAYSVKNLWSPKQYEEQGIYSVPPIRRPATPILSDSPVSLGATWSPPQAHALQVTAPSIPMGYRRPSHRSTQDTRHMTRGQARRESSATRSRVRESTAAPSRSSEDVLSRTRPSYLPSLMVHRSPSIDSVDIMIQAPSRPPSMSSSGSEDNAGYLSPYMSPAELPLPSEAPEVASQIPLSELTDLPPGFIPIAPSQTWPLPGMSRF